MSEADKFDGPDNQAGLTTWGDASDAFAGWETGWYPGSSTDFVIGRSDPYWGQMLTLAQQQYGDPGIRYNTGEPRDGERYLVFSDGTRVPSDGAIVYHAPANSETGAPAQNWIRNTDGTYQPATTTGDGTYVPAAGEPAFRPAGYRRFDNGNVAPINSAGAQIGAQSPNSLNSNDFHFDPATNTYTPLSADGDYYEIQPDGSRVYRDREGNVIPPQQYFGDTAAPDNGPQEPLPPYPQDPAPLESQAVVRPDGMDELKYPEWATDRDPDVGNQLTGVVARLFEMFGTGTPAQSELPVFPFDTQDASGSGIDEYEGKKEEFLRIEAEFDATAQAFRDAITNSANLTQAGRDALNDAISTFNDTVKPLEDGEWDALLRAETTLLETAKTAVQEAANSQQQLPGVPDSGPTSPTGPGSTTPGATTPMPSVDPSSLSTDPAQNGQGLEELLSGLGASSPTDALSGLTNPLAALSGMNPLGSQGTQGNSGASPLSSLTDAVKPLSQLADQTDSTDSPGEEEPAITPLSPEVQPIQDPAAATTEPAQVQAPATAAVPEPEPERQQDPGAAPAAAETPAATVTLPDGTIVEAPNEQAAQAAQNALDEASPGGDAAQKAYSDTGVELPSDGQNLGAKVDPADMQAGDVLRWNDQTMVAVGPGLVADPTQPGLVHTLEDVLKDPTGFEGIFRPTEIDPTLSAPNEPPPLVAEPQPQEPHVPQDESSTPQPDAPTPTPTEEPIPLSGPDPTGATPQAAVPEATLPQHAPPSPFESTVPPPATRTTRDERIAAGME